jgi:cystathionine beta-lyase/cystathionine gamma-synthase/proteasome lid subunit RPN8/RPN11
VVNEEYRFETRAIHVGQEPDPETGALVPPIVTAAAFERVSVDQQRTYGYSRRGNPTRAALETALANLEGGRFAHAYPSGIAAVAAVGQLLETGKHVLLPDDVYGNTYRLYVEIFSRHGVESEFVDMTDLDLLASKIRSNTGLIFTESPTNPRLRVLELGAIGRLGRERGILTACDNSFCSPYFQRPLELGIDICVESTTKYLNGHDDVMGGAVIVNDERLSERLHLTQYIGGAAPSPFDCYLLLRGLRTLPLRMERHQANALSIARWLAAHPKVEVVHHPGLPEHPGHALALTQQSGYSGMLSFEVDGDGGAARRVIHALKLFKLAGGLGGVESLVAYPTTMSHLSQAGQSIAPPESLIRLSVGCEHLADLLADLDQALAQAFPDAARPSEQVALASEAPMPTPVVAQEAKRTRVTIQETHRQQMIEHARRELPNEACGLLAGQGCRVEKVHLARNKDQSPVRYEVEPADLLRIFREIDEDDMQLVGIFHSHVASPARPSQTDIRLAYYPDAFYFLVSLQNRQEPELRAYTIVDGKVTEVDLVVEP